MPNKTAMDIGFDKYKTIQHLKGVGLPYPWTTINNANRGQKNIKKLPCILKSRDGCGSSKVFVLIRKKMQNMETFLKVIYGKSTLTLKTVNSHVVFIAARKNQLELLSSKEYCHGLTGFAEVIENESIRQVCENVAHSLNLWKHKYTAAVI